jgi:hypothetical protein
LSDLQQTFDAAAISQRYAAQCNVVAAESHPKAALGAMAGEEGQAAIIMAATASSMQLKK